MKSLIVVAHMDDEALSCGGLIARSEEAHVVVVYGRKYVGESASQNEESLIAERDDFYQSLLTLGCTRCTLLMLEEGEPHRVGYYAVLEKIEEVLRQTDFDEVVLPSELDMNQDHRMLADVMKIVCRPANLGTVKRVLKSLAHDSKMVTPQYFVPMTQEEMDRKIDAIGCYRREARSKAHPRSPENIVAMARIHGSKCGHEYAEGYEVHLIREST